MLLAVVLTTSGRIADGLDLWGKPNLVPPRSPDNAIFALPEGPELNRFAMRFPNAEDRTVAGASAWVAHR